VEASLTDLTSSSISTLEMKLTLAQNLPLRTYIINSSNEILYQGNTPDNGSFTTISRKHSTLPTSDTASEHTLVESQWNQLARLCWNNPESSQILVPALAQREDIFKSILRWEGCLISKFGLHLTGLVSREFTFTASDGRAYAWKLGPLGASSPTVSSLSLEPAHINGSKAPVQLVLKDSPEEVLVTYHSNSTFRPAIRSHLDIVDREDVLSILDDIVLTFVLVQRCRRLMRESHLPPPRTWFADAESRSVHALYKG